MLEHYRALLEALGGDAMVIGLAQGGSARPAGSLVFPAAEPPNGRLREARRLEAAQRDRERGARTQYFVTTRTEVQRKEARPVLRHQASL